MQQKVTDLQEALPAGIDIVSGAFEIDGGYSIHCTAASSIGDLKHAAFELVTESGRAEYTIMGRGPYLVDWGSYEFRRGFSCAAQIEAPLIEMHFQLDGSAHAVNSPMGMAFQLRTGDSNFAVIPPMRSDFSVEDDSRGAMFEVMLARSYFLELAERYPTLLDRFVGKLERQEPMLLCDENLPITPRMHAVINRLRHDHTSSVTGSLFLEAQILELLALQFAQIERFGSRPANGLSRADADRIRAAGAWLLERIDDPPSLQELARFALMNEFKLKKGFREIFGSSPYAYLLQHKLELARSYVLDTDWTIADIAYRVGYRDPAHLTHAFRKHFGIRPSDLRRPAALA